jgi:hypothetical protein
MMYRTRFFPARLLIKRVQDGDAISQKLLSRYDGFVAAGDSTMRISLPQPSKSYDSRGFVVINDGSLSLPIDCVGGFLGDNDTTSIGGGNIMRFVCLRTGPDKWYWCEGG